VQVGEKFKLGRYVVLKKLGWGHFSTVWLVLDTRNHTFAALKVGWQTSAHAMLFSPADTAQQLWTCLLL
jgi:serine/threonine-protein kinase SRPK3